MTNPVALIILDGFGLAPAGPGNAVALARTPVFDRLWRERPHTQLQASGPAVGLPEGQMGNSEVGHLNLGAGRVVKQSLTYIQGLIDDGSFYTNPVLLRTFAAARGHTLHLLGLVSDGGVHSDLKHLLALLELAGRERLARVRVHAFTDGRDSPPDGGVRYLATLEEALARLREAGCDARVATVCGRYYAMDRDRRWERTKLAYDLIVCARGEYTAGSAVAAAEAAYARGETDEFIRPTVITTDSTPSEDGAADDGAVRDGDAVLYFNFRTDRARQLSHALVGDDGWGGFERCRTPRTTFASLMEYDKELHVPFAFSVPPVLETLPEVLAEAGLKQYHTAETEKYAHVTYFFDAQREEQQVGEERRMVASPKVATYDLQPEMSARELAALTAARLRERDDNFVLVNFANPDMVGHTGVIAAAVEACEVVDACLGEVLDAVLARGGAAIVLADHGNAEKMLEADGSPHTAHTTNPVPCVLVSDDPALANARLRPGGILGDVAPTVLELLGVPQPPQMTGKSLLARG
ncbi:MAG: 2,3-bisphosphoglycerate-independent phosphoglycerate mutase [Trueperaceae bacterium]|nr:2,3-bisphosphoglycerate-independent phosphoglycerate mutase [Trueperaceae bacterium]